MWRGPAWLTIVRDVACLVLPGVAFMVEVFKEKPSVELLIVYMGLVAVPGLAGAVTLARHGGGGTEPPPSPSAPPPVSPPSPSSSSSSQGG